MTTSIADPTLHVDLSVSTLRQAQATELFNARIALQAAVSDLNRVKANAFQGNRQAAIDGYNRAWSRVELHARRIYEMTGEESEVPAYDPPQPLGAGKTVRLGKPDPFALPEAQPKSAKPIPGNIKPGTARWYRIQGQTPPEACPE